MQSSGMTLADIVQICLLAVGFAAVVALLLRPRRVPTPPRPETTRTESLREEVLELKAMVQRLATTVESIHDREAAAPVAVELPAAIPDPQPVEVPVVPTEAASLEESLTGLEQAARRIVGDVATEAYARQLADRTHRMLGILERPLFAGADLEEAITCVFEPSAIPTWQVSEGLRALAATFDELRHRVIAELHARGVREIYPIIYHDRFDASLHVDAGGSPGRAHQPAEDQQIVEVLRAGIQLDGAVAFKAKVFRLQSEAVPARELSIDDLPEPKPTGDVGW